MKSPAFSFFVRDYLCSKTISKLHSKVCSNGYNRGVSVYMFLLCASWLEDPPATLPSDDSELAGLARVPIEEWLEYKPLLIHKFQRLPSGRLYDERLMEEWKKQQKRKSAGSKGGSKKVANRVAHATTAQEDENEVENEYELGNGGEGERGGGTTQQPNGTYHPDTRLALHWLSDQSGLRYQEVYYNLDLISARLSEPGVDIEGVKKMITRQVKRWKGTTQQEFLRPQTLFNPEKFAGYYAARDLAIETQDRKKPNAFTAPQELSKEELDAREERREAEYLKKPMVEMYPRKQPPQ